MSLIQLKKFTAAQHDMEELHTLNAFAKNLVASYEEHGQDQPDWLLEATELISNEISTRAKEDLKRKLALAKGRLEGLKTPSEKRLDVEREINRLTKAINA